VSGRPRNCIFRCVRFGDPAFWRDTLWREEQMLVATAIDHRDMGDELLDLIESALDDPWHRQILAHLRSEYWNPDPMEIVVALGAEVGHYAAGMIGLSVYPVDRVRAVAESVVWVREGIRQAAEFKKSVGHLEEPKRRGRTIRNLFPV
jgi:hypothetical protein